MKSKKAPKEPDSSAEQIEIEERVRQMLDPSIPDEPEGITVSDATAKPLPTDIDDPAISPIKIEIKGHDKPLVTANPLDNVEEPIGPPALPSASSKEPSAEEKQLKKHTKRKKAPKDEAKTAESDQTTAPALPEDSLTPKKITIDQQDDTESIDVYLDDDKPKPEEAIQGGVIPDEKQAGPSPTAIDDPETEAAVDDIVAEESDSLLAAQDEEVSEAIDDSPKTFRARMSRFFGRWWHNRLARNASIAIVVIGITAAFLVPVSRYFILNNVGIRGTVSVIVRDNSTNQPLRNVRVTITNNEVLTDGDGRAVISHLRLGPNLVKVNKRAFAPYEQQLTLNWGNNNLSDVKLTPVGSQYEFVISDFLSGKPVEKAEAISGEASAFSDAEGRIKLTVDKHDDEPFKVKIIYADARNESVTLSAEETKITSVRLVPKRPHVFISKRLGKFDVYRIDADGKNEKLVLAGTGSERDDIVMLTHPIEDRVAIVSTRSGKRNEDGFLLSSLNMIDLRDNSVKSIASSERIQLIEWFDNRIVYVQVKSGASAVDPNRHRLISYDTSTNEAKELARSNYFNDVLAANGYVYVAPSGAYQKEAVEFYRINPDGSDKRTIIAQEVWNIFRTDYDILTLATSQDWYKLTISDSYAELLSGEPSSPDSRLYVYSPDKQFSLWTERRDGKGVLIFYDIPANKNTVLVEKSGLKTPIRWLNNRTVVFRVGSEQESADYVVSLDGGGARKIRDVTDTDGIDRWYYY